MKRLRTYQQMEAYLTKDAKEVINQLVDLGVRDLDLAHQMAEDLLGSEQMYRIEEEDGSEERRAD